MESTIKKGEETGDIYREKKMVPTAAHRPTGPPPRLAVFMPVMHALPGGRTVP